jgi:hypothetical protein
MYVTMKLLFFYKKKILEYGLQPIVLNHLRQKV